MNTDLQDKKTTKKLKIFDSNALRTKNIFPQEENEWPSSYFG